MLKSYLKALSSMALVATISTGCGSSNTTEPVVAKTYTGIFVDVTTDGISYTCGTVSGVTSNGGKFTGCAEGDTVSFSLGNLSLGSMKRPSNGVFTPRGLAQAKYPNDAAAAAVAANNMAAAILSLDADGDATNGISITSKNITLFNASVPAGSSILDSGTATVVLAAVSAVVSHPANATSGMRTVTVEEAASHQDEVAVNIQSGTFDQPAASFPQTTGGTGGSN